MKSFEDKIEELEQQKTNRKYVAKTLNTSGWYRVANLGTTVGKGRAFLLSLSSDYGYTTNCSYLLSINMVHNKAKITLLNSLVNDSVISKVRVIKDANNQGYLEIFYKYSQGNSVKCEIVNDYDQATMLDYEIAEDNITVLDEITLDNNITNGQEFKTGRSIGGKVEYGKRIDCGNLPNAITKNVNHGISNLKDLTFGIVSITSGAGSTYINNLGSTVSLSTAKAMYFGVSGDVIFIKTTADESSSKAIAEIHYTKN